MLLLFTPSYILYSSRLLSIASLLMAASCYDLPRNVLDMCNQWAEYDTDVKEISHVYNQCSVISFPLDESADPFPIIKATSHCTTEARPLCSFSRSFRPLDIRRRVRAPMCLLLLLIIKLNIIHQV